MISIKAIINDPPFPGAKRGNPGDGVDERISFRRPTDEAIDSYIKSIRKNLHPKKICSEKVTTEDGQEVEIEDPLDDDFEPLTGLVTSGSRRPRSLSVK